MPRRSVAASSACACLLVLSLLSPSVAVITYHRDCVSYRTLEVKVNRFTRDIWGSRLMYSVKLCVTGETNLVMADEKKKSLRCWSVRSLSQKLGWRVGACGRQGGWARRMLEEAVGVEENGTLVGAVAVKKVEVKRERKVKPDPDLLARVAKARIGKEEGRMRGGTSERVAKKLGLSVSVRDSCYSSYQCYYVCCLMGSIYGRAPWDCYDSCERFV